VKCLLILTGLFVSCSAGMSQCSYTAILSSAGINCVGSSTLSVNSSGDLSKIVWYNGNTIVNIATVGEYSDSGITVAGGNGEGSAADQLQGPEGVYMDGSGNIYISDAANYRVQKWAPGASVGTTVAGGNGQGTAANQIDGHAGIYVDVVGNVYIADAGNNRVQKWLPGAGIGITVAGGNGKGSQPDQLNTPEGVFVDAAMNVYVADAGNNRIQKWPAGSSIGLTVAGGNGQGNAADQFNVPGNVFVDNNGNIFVADYANNRIQKWLPGAATGVTVAGGNGQGDAANQLNGPQAVFVDSNNNIYVADLLNDRVQKWAPSGSTGITVAGGNGFGYAANQLAHPYYVYVDKGGNVYVADYGNNRIQEWVQKNTINTTYKPFTAGTYTASVTDTAGCTISTNAVSITPNINTSVSIASSSDKICEGDTVTFTASPVNGGIDPSYQWQKNGINVGETGDVFISNSLVDSDMISCIMKSDLACTFPASSLNTIRIAVNTKPVVIAGDDTTIAPGKSVILHPSTTGNIISYSWMPAIGLSDPSIPDPAATPVNTTTYQLSVSDSKGCTASGRITIQVYYPLQMPNAFTPNGDGKNDVFRVPVTSINKIISFRIFNRWGNQIFITNNQSEGWNGNWNNQPQPAGTYVWEIRYENTLTGKIERSTGTVTLIR
jgi:gliding motility-associated-like protein